MKYLICVLLTCIAIEANCQVKISGIVKNELGNPVPYATVYLDKVFEGGAANEAGYFEFTTDAKGLYSLEGSALGHETAKQEITIGSEPIHVDLILFATSQQLEMVTVSAGTFDARDKTKSPMLKPLDILRNAGAQGDIYKAIETLPGVSKVGDETGLFVRGGDAHETRTIIDGTIVEKPFFSESPNMASRSRFDPFMFKGTTFTTGGYSAEYGGALSSVLLLQTQDIPDKTTSSLSLNMAGASLSHQQLWNKKTTLLGSISYNNLGLLFNSVPQNVNWKKEPEGYGSNWAFRHKGKKGLFKTLLQHQQARLSLNQHNFEDLDTPIEFANKNSTTYLNTNYEGNLSPKLKIYAGAALNRSTDKIKYDGQNIDKQTNVLQGKTTLLYNINRGVDVKLGIESFLEKDEIEVSDVYQINDQYSAAFTETDFRLGNRLAFRLGLRSEYSNLLNKSNIAHRTSMAYKTGVNSQISIAYGHFYQKPEDDFLFRKNTLEFEKSSHLIANYQWIVEGRSFRVELYNKQYDNLIKTNTEGNLTNKGDGFSRGIDVFWKDSKSIKNLDYWVSYSFIDAERDYKDYPKAATPTFVTNHTFNVVANYSIPVLGLQPGITYTYASGRRYFNPTNENYLSDKTKAYHNLSLNLSYITKLFNKFAVLYGALSNPFGFDQVFGYRYSENGQDRIEIRPTADRTFFLGLFVNF
jgi:outer membrane cobalamin receptor